MSPHGGLRSPQRLTLRTSEFVLQQWAHSDSSGQTGQSRSTSSYNRLAMLLYYITDRRSFAGNDADQHAALLRRIAEAARSGIDFIQLREKDLQAAEIELLAREAIHLIRENSATTKLLINTHADIALA